MKSLKLHLENCHGIRKLRHTFDFEMCNSAVIYAPNGSMKSSLANTLDDYCKGVDSKDNIFRHRETKRDILDKDGKKIDPKSILVVGPIQKEVGKRERVSTLLVNDELRKEYEELLKKINIVKNNFVEAMKNEFNSKKDVMDEISIAFTGTTKRFEDAIMRVSNEVENQDTPQFLEVPYDVVFHDRVKDALEDPLVQEALESYILHFNSLISKSKFFKLGTFNYYNAKTIAASLKKNGFFEAKHVIRFVDQIKNNDKEIETLKDLEDIIDQEKEDIASDETLREKFQKIEDRLNKNDYTRKFLEYIHKDEFILPHVLNFRTFKEEVWKSYFVNRKDIFNNLISELKGIQQRKKEIEEEARKQKSAWEEVIETFNNRFFVPFELKVGNFFDVAMGEEKIPNLEFVFKEVEDGKEVSSDVDDEDHLKSVLSTGELRAFYILNVIFEINVRERNGEDTILVLDDIADSFDYKNKYAIIQYLDEISKYRNFNQIILTHNYDFFRSIIRTKNIAHSKNMQLMVEKKEDKILLMNAKWSNNVFVDDWKVNFEMSPRKRIASIPFMRNLVEYTKGTGDEIYSKLTSLLHIKTGTINIMDSELYGIYKQVFNLPLDDSKSTPKSVVQLIFDEANDCLDEKGDNPKLENKIVLSVATRLAAEEYMIVRIDNRDVTNSIVDSQTRELYEMFKAQFENDAAVSVMNRVVLMTPENIHLNSFMYEPLVDMSDDHLKKIFSEVKELLKSIDGKLEWDINY